jgi:hypothetical protein
MERSWGTSYGYTGCIGHKGGKAWYSLWLTKDVHGPTLWASQRNPSELGGEKVRGMGVWFIPAYREPAQLLAEGFKTGKAAKAWADEWAGQNGF